MSTVDASGLDFSSVSLPVLEQEELSVCVIKKECPYLVKRNDIAINIIVLFKNFSIKSTSRRRAYGNAILHHAKHSQVQKIIRHLPL